MNKNKGFVIFTINKINSLVTDLYESLMDDDIDDAKKIIGETEEVITDLKETIENDEFKKRL